MIKLVPESGGYSFEADGRRFKVLRRHFGGGGWRVIEVGADGNGIVVRTLSGARAVIAGALQ